MKWLFRLEEDYECDLRHYISAEDLNQLKSEIRKDVYFLESSGSAKARLRITKDGDIFVFKGYSWDGNSPKINFLDLFWLGTPDGIVSNNKPITYYASLIHDILGQFKRHPEMPSKFRAATSPELWLSKGRIGRDGLYFSMLKQQNFLFRHLYFLAVALAGPLYDYYLAVVKKVQF